jgi:hypothetical protein
MAERTSQNKKNAGNWGARGEAETRRRCAATEVDGHAMRDEPLLQWTIQTDAHARSREAAAWGGDDSERLEVTKGQ